MSRAPPRQPGTDQDCHQLGFRIAYMNARLDIVIQSRFGRLCAEQRVFAPIRNDLNLEVDGMRAQEAPVPKNCQRCVMSGQSQLNVMNSRSQVVLSARRSLGASSERITVRSSRVEDAAKVDVDRLLEDVRLALDSDLDSATQAAGRLVAVLASKLHQDARPLQAPRGLLPWQERKIRAFIEDRIADRLLVDDMARVVSLSVSYFSRSFKQSFGLSPHAYVVRTRVARAQTLMRTTRESLPQIAFACGLLDQAHLCRRFRQVAGMTPAAWRRSQTIGP